MYLFQKRVKSIAVNKTIPILMLFTLTRILDCHAMVKFDEGRLVLEGIQLFQDRDIPSDYYYLPNSPSLTRKPDGTLDFLFMKYAGQGGETSSGGLLHALIGFELSANEVSKLAKALSKKVPGARLKGPVPLQEASKQGTGSLGSFWLLTSVLGAGLSGSTPKIITSGKAPLYPGSKAAIAVGMTQAQATLLWESMKGATSDVSVVIEAYFEASLKSYQAEVRADLNEVYEYFIGPQHGRYGFDRPELLRHVDSLVRTQAIRIEAVDRGPAAGISTVAIQNIQEVVVNQLIRSIFETRTGWASIGDGEIPVKTDLADRFGSGWLPDIAWDKANQPYRSYTYYVLKEKSEVKQFNFLLDLTQSSTIKVPVRAAGNLQVFYEQCEEGNPYFQVVNLAMPDFQHRQVFCQLNSDYLEVFNEIVNFASVRFRKRLGNGEGASTVADTTIVFSRKDLLSGIDFKSFSYPRLGVQDSTWLTYEYRTAWSIKGIEPQKSSSVAEEKWVLASDPVLFLKPPLSKVEIDLDVDPEIMRQQEISVAEIHFYVILGGTPVLQKQVLVKSREGIGLLRVNLFADPGEPIVYRVRWYGKNGIVEDEVRVLNSDYIYLFPVTAGK